MTVITGGCWEPRAHARVSESSIFFFATSSISDDLIVVGWCVIAAAAVVVAVLRGPLSGIAGVAEHGLGAIRNLALNSYDNIRLLGAADACKGKRLLYFLLRHVFYV